MWKEIKNEGRWIDKILIVPIDESMPKEAAHNYLINVRDQFCKEQLDHMLIVSEHSPRATWRIIDLSSNYSTIKR